MCLPSELSSWPDLIRPSHSATRALRIKGDGIDTRSSPGMTTIRAGWPAGRSCLPEGATQPIYITSAWLRVGQEHHILGALSISRELSLAGPVVRTYGAHLRVGSRDRISTTLRLRFSRLLQSPARLDSVPEPTAPNGRNFVRQSRVARARPRARRRSARRTGGRYIAAAPRKAAPADPAGRERVAILADPQRGRSAPLIDASSRSRGRVALSVIHKRRKFFRLVDGSSNVGPGCSARATACGPARLRSGFPRRAARRLRPGGGRSATATAISTGRSPTYSARQGLASPALRSPAGGRARSPRAARPAAADRDGAG